MVSIRSTSLAVLEGNTFLTSWNGLSPPVFDFCHILLAAGAQVDVTDRAQQSALHFAAADFDDYNFIIAIVDNGCPIELVTERHYSYYVIVEQKWTVLMVAIDSLNLSSTRALLDRGASTDVLNADHFFPRLEDRDDSNKAMEMYNLLVSRVSLRCDWLVDFGLIIAAKNGIVALQRFHRAVNWLDCNSSRCDTLDKAFKLMLDDREWDDAEHSIYPSTTLLDFGFIESSRKPVRFLLAALHVQAYDVVDLLRAHGISLESNRVLNCMLQDDQDAEKICRYLRLRFYMPS